MVQSLFDIAFADIIPKYFDVVVSIRSTLLVDETDDVHQLVNNRCSVDTSFSKI